MSAKHTPAPWLINEMDEQILGGANGDRVVVYELNTNAADARLIAAAPRLLELAEFLVNRMSPPCLDIMCGEGFHDKVKAIVLDAGGDVENA